MCFQAQIGCLRPTSDPETLSKDPHHVYKFTRGKFSSMNIFIFIQTADFVLHKLKYPFRVFSQSLKVSGRLQAAYLSMKAHWWLWWTWMLVGVNLPLIYDLKQLRKLDLCENWDFHTLFTFDTLSERPCICINIHCILNKANCANSAFNWLKDRTFEHKFLAKMLRKGLKRLENRQ